MSCTDSTRVRDASGRDAGGHDRGSRDDGGHVINRDSGPQDSGARDSGRRDSGPPDSGPRDSGDVDAARRDAGGIVQDAATCEFSAPPTMMALCLATEASLIVIPSVEVVFELKSARVIEVGSGMAPDGCFSRYYTLIGAQVGNWPQAQNAARWFRVEDAMGVQALVGVHATSPLEWPVELDALVDLRYWRGGGEPRRARLELRSADGELLGWLGSSGTVEELDKPAELVLARGRDACQRGDGSAPTWSQYDLDVRLATSAERTPVPHGKQVQVGDFWVTNGGVGSDIVVAEAHAAR